jgi:hypothetical protein
LTDGVIKMVLQDCYEIAVEVVKQKVIPLIETWGLKTVPEGYPREGLSNWCIANREGTRHLGLGVEKHDTFIELFANSRRLYIYPEEVRSDEELREKAWKFFRRSLEHFVALLVWQHIPVHWQRKGRRLFMRRKSILLDLTFTIGKKTWKWEIEQVIYPEKGWGYPQLRKLGVVRRPIHEDPVMAGAAIVEHEGLAYL